MATYTGVRIVSASRLNLSTNGNPRFLMVLDIPGQGPAEVQTQSDAACSYEVENYTHSRYQGRTFTIETTRAGRVSYITPEV